MLGSNHGRVQVVDQPLTLDAQNNIWCRNTEKVLKEYSNYYQDTFCISLSEKRIEYQKATERVALFGHMLRKSFQYSRNFLQKRQKKIGIPFQYFSNIFGPSIVLCIQCELRAIMIIILIKLLNLVTKFEVVHRHSCGPDSRLSLKSCVPHGVPACVFIVPLITTSSNRQRSLRYYATFADYSREKSYFCSQPEW